MPSFITPFAERELLRQPERSDDSLLAFDAADHYLLTHLHEQGIAPSTRLLLLNDSFGALACSLAGHCRVTSSGDSFLGEQALNKNLQRNHLPADSVAFIPATEIPQGPFDRVLIRIPKTLALLEEQLIRLHGQLTPDAEVHAGAMLKHLPRAATELLEKYIGPTRASLAVRKARLLLSRAQPGLKPPQSPYPTRYSLDDPPLTLVNHANVFSRTGLDIGSRTLLPHLPRHSAAQQVADLGCGNGLLGIVYALRNPQAELLLVDESYMAVQSARENWQAALGSRPVTLRVADGLDGQPAGSLDRVLCNPPFHQQQAIGDFLARRMFRQAHRALISGGELWIVGNRHLGYHLSLRRLFRQVEQIAANPKFVVLKAVK